jgi:multisubunit Na+/H+ antiporter MnhG subunit
MARQIAIAVLLFAATVFALISAIGVLRSKNNLAALHCAGVTNVLVPVLAMAAVLVDIPAGQSTVKMAVLTVVLLAGGPIVSHAIAVAEYRRKPRR